MPPQSPAFLTFTGIDEWTDLGRVRALSERHPLEWGVLFSPRLQGRHPRYPSMDVVDRVARDLGGRVGLAAHLCGGHADAILAEARCPGVEGLADRGFGRFQVNTTAPLPDPGMVAAFASAHGGIGILQCRDSSPRAFPADDRVAWLYDASGGRGLAPRAWPPHPDGGRLVGYAGGIGPGTAAAVVGSVGAGRLPGQPFWLDMETRIRTDDRLDLDLCEVVINATYGER